jgi:hypothetical protein
MLKTQSECRIVIIKAEESGGYGDKGSWIMGTKTNR